MPNRRAWLLLLLVFALRLPTLWWDSGLLSPHPDERQVAFVSERVEGWFDDPEFYAYGSLHFQAVRLVAGALGVADQYKGLLMGGRVLSLVSSILAIAVGWWLVRRVWGRRTAELYLLLVAFVPLDLQQAHYATVEAHHALWVVLAIAACWCLAMTGSRPWAMAAGAAIGASLAVKVASLGLVVPLAVALLIASRSRRWLTALELAVISVTAGVLAFWLAQPWAFSGGRPPVALLVIAMAVVVVLRLPGRHDRPFLVELSLGGIAVAATAVLVALGMLEGSLVPRLNPEYLRGVGEQVAMVTGAGDLPYVRVYHGTLAVLYPLRELIRWGVGPLIVVMVTAGGAGCWWLLRRWRCWLDGVWTPSAALIAVVAAWLGPVAVRLATLQVKYLRYWEPLVVPAVMVAAWGLERAPRRWRRSAVHITVAATALWGVTYLWAFAAPHPHRTAAGWLRMMVSQDQVVAFEHWDETVALPGVTTVELPSYDLPDDDAKLLRLGRTLAGADWLVMTSNRVRRTVLVNRERFPRAGRLYRLLLAGEAGFEPVARIDRQPRLFQLRRPVQLADESFLNYDFPRVVVLRRVEDVDPAALAARTERPLPFLEQLSAAELDRRFVETLPAVPAVPTATSQAVDVATWLVVFGALAVATWMLLLPVLRGWPDAGVGLAMVTGWLTPAWLLWIGSELGLWPVGGATASWILVAMVAAGAVAGWRRRELLARLVRQRRRAILLVLVVAAVVWLLFAAVRASNPAIFWGEKPMDFSFLNAFLRADAWPTDEPWMAGMPLHYYYFGEVLASFPILVGGIDSAVGYNLMSATIPALGAIVLAALGLAVVRRVRFTAAVLMPVLVLLTGNLAWPFLLDMARSGHWFDLWWATSRVVPGFAIDEYPLWTALFADLHGHFIALPVLLAAALWGWLTVTRTRWWPAAAVLCGITTSVLVATNPWDLFVLIAALGLGTLLAAPRPFLGLLRLAVAGAVSIVAGLPFIVELVAGIGAGAGGRMLHLTDADFAPAWAMLRHFGQFLVPLAALALLVAWRVRVWLFALPVAAAAAVLGLAIRSSAAALALAAAVLFAAVLVGTRDRLARLAWTLAVLAMLAVAACERFTLIDRMNTLFKIYNGVWVLLALALAVLLLRERGSRLRLLAATWVPLQLVALVNLPLGIAQGWLEPRIASPRPTLDGRAFLEKADPQTWFLVRALEGVARPNDVVAEAARIAYASYTRIAMHTGQPTVVGWPWHLEQRGQSRQEVDARYRDLTILYSGSDPVRRRQVIERYRIRWVVLGDLERTTYDLVGDRPLIGVPGLFRFAEHGGATLLMVRERIPTAPAVDAARDRELPKEVTAIGSVPVVSPAVVRSLAADDQGGAAVLRDGSVLEIDPVGRPIRRTRETPCGAASVVRLRGDTWLGCQDGTVWRASGDRWRRGGSVTGTAHLTAGNSLWAWGEQGLWRMLATGRWQKIGDGPIVAASAAGRSVAASDGGRVWVWSSGQRRAVGSPLTGVRWLAWQGPLLWALTDDGLYRSGGGVLPWRRSLVDLTGVAAIAGSGNRLWLVLDDGTLVQSVLERCGSPWQKSGELREPRDLVVSGAGWLAVADTLHHRVCWFTLAGDCLDSFGEEGALPGQFRQPSGLALARDGTLAVADTWNSRIQLLRPGAPVQIVGESLYGPRDLLWLPDGSLLVADTGNRQLLVYRPPRWSRQEIAELGAPVVGLEWVGGLVAAALPVAAEVALLDPESWTVVRTIPVPGWEGGSQQEGYLVMLPSGDLLASAPERHELWRLDPTGARPPVRVRDDLPGVTGLALSPDGDVIATQTWEDRLLRLQIGE